MILVADNVLLPILGHIESYIEHNYTSVKYNSMKITEMMDYYYFAFRSEYI